MANLDRRLLAQESVIGAMLIDERCIPLVLSKLIPDDFIDGTCRATFTAIRKLTLEGRSVDPVTVVEAMQGGDRYIAWAREVMDLTPTAANVGEYIPMVQKAARRRRILELSEKLSEADDDELDALVRQMASALSATQRMPMMTGPERVADFHRRMQDPEKPKYLPWGIPTADRNTYAELGDMILLGGYASSGKTLLSIAMATAQAKAGYKVGYYSLETSPRKMTDRQMSALAKVPLWKIKKKDFGENDWRQLAEAESFAAAQGSFPIIDASGTTADDITAHAIGHGFQIIYVDYVQLLRAPGVKDSDGYARVTAVSQSLKTFSRNTNTAVVALAQLTRPRDGEKQDSMPTMHSFKESGQLEQDADVAFLVFPSKMADNTSPRLFRIVKNKEGARPDPVYLNFQGDIQTMVELERDAAAEVMAELNAKGRAVKQRNRARAWGAEFREVPAGDDYNPFEQMKI